MPVLIFRCRTRPDGTADPGDKKLSSGKPIVQSYMVHKEKGKSWKAFGRLWWDETFPTLTTRGELTFQRFMHPQQHRGLTIRECARVQGFPGAWHCVIGILLEFCVRLVQDSRFCPQEGW